MPVMQESAAQQSQFRKTKRKAAEYGLSGRTANACLFQEIRVRIPCLPLAVVWPWLLFMLRFALLMAEPEAGGFGNAFMSTVEDRDSTGC